MNDSKPRLPRVAAAVVGMVALSAATSGTALADAGHDDRATNPVRTVDGTDTLPAGTSPGNELYAFETPSLGSQNVRKVAKDRDDDGASTGGYDADVDNDGDADDDVRDAPRDDYDGPHKHFYDDYDKTDKYRGSEYQRYDSDDHESGLGALGDLF